MKRPHKPQPKTDGDRLQIRATWCAVDPGSDIQAVTEAANAATERTGIGTVLIRERPYPLFDFDWDRNKAHGESRPSLYGQLDYLLYVRKEWVQSVQWQLRYALLDPQTREVRKRIIDGLNQSFLTKIDSEIEYVEQCLAARALTDRAPESPEQLHARAVAWEAAHESQEAREEMKAWAAIGESQRKAAEIQRENQSSEVQEIEPGNRLEQLYRRAKETYHERKKKLGRPPTQEAMFLKLNMSRSTYQRFLRDLRADRPDLPWPPPPPSNLPASL